MSVISWLSGLAVQCAAVSHPVPLLTRLRRGFQSTAIVIRIPSPSRGALFGFTKVLRKNRLLLPIQIHGSLRKHRYRDTLDHGIRYSSCRRKECRLDYLGKDRQCKVAGRG